MSGKKLNQTMKEIKDLIKEAKQYDDKPQRESQFMKEFYECLTGREATPEDYLFREYIRTIWREMNEKKERSKDRNTIFTLSINKKPILKTKRSG